MAKNKRGRTRETTRFTNQRLRFDLPIKPGPSPFTPSYNTLIDIEDRRTWHPDPIRPAASFNTSRHRLTLPTNVNTANSQPRSSNRYAARYPTAQISFQQPKRVLVCVRRQIRKNVLFALNKTGKGGQRRPRWTPYSYVNCR